MFNLLRRMFGPSKAKAIQPIGNTGPWGSEIAGAWPGSPDFAENVASIAACVSLISGTIATLPATVFKRTGPDERTPAPDHPLQRIIDNGSDGLTWADLLQAWLADGLLSGNALLAIRTSQAGRLVGLEWLPWSRVSCRQLSTGAIVYEYVGTNGSMTRFLPDELVHLRDRLDPAQPYLGRSRLKRSPGVVNFAAELTYTAQKMQGNAARPGGVLTAPGKISDDLAKRLREDFDANFSGARRGKTAVLGEGLEFKITDGADAQSAQLVEQLLWSLQECARLFNVPSQLVGDLSAATYTNSAQAARALATFALAPWVDKIQAVFRSAVLSGPYEIEIDLAELMRGDVEGYFKSLALFRNSAIITANEARVLTGFGRHPSSDADELEAVQHGGGPETQPSDADAPGTDKPGAKPAKGVRLVG